MLKVTSAKLSSAPGSTGWAQAHEFEPQDDEKLQLRGKLFVVIATSQMEQGIDVIAAGRELLSRLNEEYYGNTDTKAFFALKSAIQKVTTEFGKSLGDVEMAALSIMGNVVYCAAVGGSKVMISRRGSVAAILESKSEVVVAASGFPEENDVMLLATKAFFTHIPFGVIKAALATPGPNDGVETLAPIVHGREGNGSICAEIIHYGKDTEVELASSVVATDPLSENSDLRKPPGEKIKSFLRSIGKKLPAKNIYIKPPLVEEVSPQSKKVTFSIALILLVLLGVSIVFGVKQKNANDLKNKYKGILEQSSGEIDQAISLATLSPERSRELFASAQEKLKQIESLNIKDSELEMLKQKINDSKSSILGEYSIPSEMFFDLTLLTSGFNGGSMVFTGGRVYVLDTLGSRIVSVDIATKKSEVVAGPGVVNNPLGLAGYESRVFVLQSDGIYEVKNNSSKVITKSWQGDALLSAFAGNIYVLDKSGGLIYRFQGLGTGFAEKQNWLADGTTANFSDSLQMVIDGSVYVLYPNAKILKFSQGSPQNFTARGVVPQIGKIDAISAGPDNEYVYLLDRAGKRIVVTDKKGVYKAQYVDEQIAAATQLTATEKDKKLILLTGEKLFSIEMKHL